MRASPIALFVAVSAAWWGGCSIDDRMLTVRNDGSVHDDASFPEGSLVIATFEKGTGEPDDPRFNPFQYYAYNTLDPSMLTSPIVPGDTSNWALALNWRITDDVNGHPDYPGVGVRTLVDGSIDLSAYDRMVFKLKYAPTPQGATLQGSFADTSTCYPSTILNTYIACTEYNATFIKTVVMPETWTTATVAFKDFKEPTYMPATGTPFADCLKVADRIDFQAQVNLSDGECAAGNLLLDDITLRSAVQTDGGASDTPPSTGIELKTDQDGWLESNAAGAMGRWYALGDYYAPDGTPGSGDCPTAGFPMAACSTLTTPTPGMPFRPDPTGKGMCTSGTAAVILNGSDGQPDYAAIWGNTISLQLANTDPNAVPKDLGTYDAPARGITGFAFDIDAVPVGGHLRVGFATPATFLGAAYWGGALGDLSPVLAGHNEFRWADVGGPYYLAAPPAFDPTMIQSIGFHIVSNRFEPVPYSFCLSNLKLLTN